MNRFAVPFVVALIAAASSAAAQSLPPSSPTIGASGGFGAGIAVPVGGLSESHSAGYILSGIVDFSAAEQPYSFRGELILQHFDRKQASTATESMNLISLGASLLARTPMQQGSSAFLIGGIAVHRVTDGGTKPGLNIGGGLEVPLTFFIGMADIRMHWVMTEGRTVLTLPITLGARF
jgi:hypothetical protein